MDEIRNAAVSTIARDTGFVAIAVFTLMFGLCFDPPLALKVGGGMTLAYAIALIFRAHQLQQETVHRSEVWRMLAPLEVMHGPQARALACDALRVTLLRFAKGAAAATIVLDSAGLAARLVW